MKVTGFSFVRNAIKYDYPVVESIQSILSLCDEFVLVVGNSDDDTLSLVKKIDRHKIRIIPSIWDDSLRRGGKVLAAETNKALVNVSDDSDWIFYIQADEVVHEKYLDSIYEAMYRWKNEEKVEGLLFKYLHFYGSYCYVGSSQRWYDKEIRILRKDDKIYSYKDAQGFRKTGNKKLSVKLIDAYIYHYGWVKQPKAMQEKQENFNKYWHDDKWIRKNILPADEFDYSTIDALSVFTGTHPKVIQEHIRKRNWNFDYDLSHNRYSLKERIKISTRKYICKHLGEYKNYRLI